VAREEQHSGNGVMDRLKDEARSLAGALGDRAVASVRGKVEGTTGRLTDYAEGGGGPGLMAAMTGARNLAEGRSPLRSMLGAGMAGVKEKVKGLFGGGKGGGSKKLKLTNIVESIDVGVPVKVAYNQWTQFSDFPRFMKKVENVDHNKKEETKTSWKAQVFWSHRTWEATVVEQVPDERIVWRSKGQKGHVDGSVTFHELAPNLTRILVVLEYHPQGLFERTGNLWRAQGRRARLELKNFRRHIMAEGVLHADEIEGWRGTIHDGEVTESHEDAVAREGSRTDGSRASRASRDRRVGDSARSRSGERSEPAKEREPAEEREEGERQETRNGRAARDRASSSGRRSTGTGSSRSTNGGNGRRQRTSAASQRGGSQ
jgi:uncharacterized membrane protein